MTKLKIKSTYPITFTRKIEKELDLDTFQFELEDYLKDFYDNDQLVALTRELTNELRRSRTIDWQKKESARANMRRIVKRLLRKYKYPPEGLEDALSTVITQCELWADS